MSYLTESVLSVSTGGQAECPDQGCWSNSGALLAQPVRQGELWYTSLDTPHFEAVIVPMITWRDLSDGRWHSKAAHAGLIPVKIVDCSKCLFSRVWMKDGTLTGSCLCCCSLCPALTSVAWSATLEPEVELQLEHPLLEHLLVETLQVNGHLSGLSRGGFISGLPSNALQKLLFFYAKKTYWLIESLQYYVFCKV